MAGTEVLISLAVSAALTGAQMLLTPIPQLPPVDRGRFDDIRIQGSEYGTMLPIVYGRARLAGNIIWSDGIQPYVTTTEQRGGKKTPVQPAQNIYTYKTSMALAICEGPITGGLKKVWEDMKVIGNFDALGVPSYLIREAEDATNTFVGAAEIVRDINANNEYKVGLPNTNDTLIFNNLNVIATGTLNLRIQYNCLVDSQLEVSVEQSGTWGSLGIQDFPAIGGTAQFGSIAIPVAFTNVDGNKVRLRNTGAPAPFIDFIAVEPDEYVPTDVTGFINPNIDPQTPTPTSTQYNHFPIEEEGGGLGRTGILLGGSGGSGAINNLAFYAGTEDQLPDSHIESIDGVGNAPAYRGVCYVVYNQYQIPDGRIPLFTFEIDEGTHDLAEVVTKLWQRVGLDASKLELDEIDGVYIRGMTIPQKTPLSEILGAISIAFGCDFVDVDGKIKAVRRGKEPIVTITEDDLQAHEYGSQMPESRIVAVYSDVNELPRKLEISYLDAAKNYHQNVQIAVRQLGWSEEPQTLTMPMVFTEAEAQEIAERVLFTIHTQRVEYQMALPPRFAWLSPADVVRLELPSLSVNVRILSMQTGMPGLVLVRAVPENAAVYTGLDLVSIASGEERPFVDYPPATRGVLMDIAPLYVTDTGHGFYVAACGEDTSRWIGARLLRETVAASGNYDDVVTLVRPSTLGVVNNALSNSPSYVSGIDVTSEVIVELYNGELDSCDPADLDTDEFKNLAYIDGELVQFATAEALNAYSPYAARYKVSDFKRGLRGTANKIATHANNEDFVLINETVIYVQEQPDLLSTSFAYQFLTLGAPSFTASPISFTSGVNSTPAPVTNLTLTQFNGTSPDGIAFTTIRGTFDFGYYIGGQRAKVSIRRATSPSTTESTFTQFGNLIAPDTLNKGQFEIPAPINGTYYVKVESLSSLDLSAASGHPTVSIAVTSVDPKPATPTGLQVTFDGQLAVWSWNASADSRHSHYQIADGSNNILADGNRLDSNSYSEYPVSGVSRRIRAVSKQGSVSDWTDPAVTLTLAAPPAPSGHAVTFDGYYLTHTWTADPSCSYEIGDASQVVIGTSRTGQFVETTVPSSRSTTRYIRSKRYGVYSAWTPTLGTAVSLPAPSAPQSVAFDTSLETPYSVGVLITAPSGLDRRHIRKTYVEVVKSSDLSLLETLEIDGVAESVVVSGRYGDTALRTIKVRAYYRDFFGNGNSAITATSHTFSAVTPSDITDPYLLGDQIKNGVLTTAAFASSIRPVELISAASLPPLPDAAYPIGAVVFWTGAPLAADKKLWRNVGNVWTKAVDAEDITANSITAGQIAAGAINAEEIAAGAVRADKLAVGVITENLIVNSSFEDFNASSFPVGWAVSGTGTATATSSTEQKSDGNYALKIAGSLANPVGNIASRAVPVTEGETYSLSLKLYSASTAGTYTVQIRAYADALPSGKFYLGSSTTGEVQATTLSPYSVTNIYNGANESLTGVALSTLNGGSWIQKEAVFTVPATVKYISVEIVTSHSGSSNLFVDGLAFRKQIRGVVIEDGTITGNKVVANSISASNLVIGSVTPNLLINSSFESLNTNGTPEAWIRFGVTGDGFSIVNRSGSGSGKYLNLGLGAGVTSRVIPVTPNDVISVGFWASQSDAGELGSTVSAVFRTTMPSSGTVEARQYIGDTADTADPDLGSDYLQRKYLSTTLANAEADITFTAPSNGFSPSTTGFAYYEGLVKVPANMYWMSVVFQMVNDNMMQVDDVNVQKRVGSAFISNLKANQIEADVIGTGLVFADQIRQQNYSPYQVGSVYSPANGEWEFTQTRVGGTGSAQEDLFNWTLTTTSYVYSSAFTVTNNDVIDGVAVFVERQNTTGTFTVSLSADNGSSATREVTVNVSTLPAYAGGRWVFFKFGSPLTSDGGNDYKVGVKSSSANSVKVYRQGITQTITLGAGNTGGTFTLTLSGQTTTAIAYNAAAATVESALASLSNVGSGNVYVTGGAGGPYTVVFFNALGGTDVATMTGTASMTGGTNTVSISKATVTTNWGRILWKPNTSWVTYNADTDSFVFENGETNWDSGVMSADWQVIEASSASLKKDGYFEFVVTEQSAGASGVAVPNYIIGGLVDSSKSPAPAMHTMFEYGLQLRAGYMDNTQMTYTSSTTTTTSYVYSSAFTLTGLTIIDGVYLYVNRETDEGTITVALSDDGGTTDTRKVTVSVINLPPAGREGWYFFKFTAPITADGGSDYKIGVKSSVAGNVKVYRDATAGNWARQVSSPSSFAVYENINGGASLGTWEFGDVFRISVENNVVYYRKNGRLVTKSAFQISSTPFGTVYPTFKGCLAFYGAGSRAVVSSVNLSQNGYGKGWRLNPSTTTTVSTIEPNWTFGAGDYPTYYRDLNLIKAGSSNALDANLSSAESIAFGDGWVQASTYTPAGTSGTNDTIFGLSNIIPESTASIDAMNFGIYFNDGVLEVWERNSGGTAEKVYTLQSGYTATDIFRVAIEGSYVRYRKNGVVFYTSAKTSFSYPYRFKVLFGKAGHGITNTLMNASSSGVGEFNSGITVRGRSLDETIVLASEALRSDRRYRGNDRSVPTSYVTDVKHSSTKVDFEDDVAHVCLEIEVNDFKTNSSRHLDSVRHARVFLLNKFGEPVQDANNKSYEGRIAWHGRGLCFVGSFSRENSDPKQELVYKIEFENIVGFSAPMYYCEGNWKTSGSRIWNPLPLNSNTSIYPPQWILRTNCPTGLTVTPLSNTSVRLSWSNATSHATANHTAYYRVFKPMGYRSSEVNEGWIEVSGAVTTGTKDVTGLVPNTRYEFTVKVTSVEHSWSPIAYVRTPYIGQVAAPTNAAPRYLSGVTAAGSGLNNRTNTITLDTNQDSHWQDCVVYYKAGANSVPSATNNDGSVTITTAGTAATAAHTTADDGVVYAYSARNRYNSGGSDYFSDYSPIITVTTYAAAPASTTPTNCSAAPLSSDSVSVSFTKNGSPAPSTHIVQIDLLGNSFNNASEYTLTGGATSTTIGGLEPDTDYEVRVRESGGTVYSNTDFVRTFPLFGGGGGRDPEFF